MTVKGLRLILKGGKGSMINPTQVVRLVFKVGKGCINKFYTRFKTSFEARAGRTAYIIINKSYTSFKASLKGGKSYPPQVLRLV